MKPFRRLVCWLLTGHRWTSGIVEHRRHMAIGTWCARCGLNSPG